MPRRRPPGTGPKLSSTLIAVLLAFPWIATAALQQQPPHNEYRSSREDAYIDAVAPHSRSQPNQERLGNRQKRSTHTSIISKNERAIATLPSAPAVSDAAVRAPPAGSAAHSGGLSSRPRARSLQDWEVEDFVLLATVDGHIHARDRNTGKELWDLTIGRPMVETIYHSKNDSSNEKSAEDSPFMWIVEPTQDGNLYVLTPGPYPVLQRLGMTVKQLAEDLSPYSSTDPPIVYVADKRNTMYTLDARTGEILKRFSSGGSRVVNEESCERVTGFEDSGVRECKGTLNLGQTEYTIAIQNSLTGEDICTIRYFEWTPNNRDRDLHSQYLSTMDNKYVYSKYDGTIFALDHTSDRKIYPSRPVYKRKLSAPVVRVFDVARPFDNDEDNPSLLVLPQPAGPATLEDDAQDVWINCTESGSWYAMSESSYPAVTDGAAKALCYNPEWNREIMAWGGENILPGKEGLIGVHSLSEHHERRADVPLISAPTVEPHVDKKHEDTPEVLHNTIPMKSIKGWWTILVALLAISLGVGSYGWAKPASFGYIKRLGKTEAPIVAIPGAPVVGPEPMVVADKPAPDADERKVRFAVPEDEPDGAPLSRATTVDEPPTDTDEPALEAADQAAAPNGNETERLADTANAVDQPKKKKAHRGQRGGKKRNKKAVKEVDEVGKIVEAAKLLDGDHPLQPDEVTVNGEGISDISNVKKIGKLTIDFDRVLGNGSGGTFVFEGKWNEREVAVKRMLPQYFGLAEQEVKLLQESDLHPNVIRYFDDEKDEHFLYIAVELCQASLWDLYRDGRPGDDMTETQLSLVNQINSNVPRALYQLALGLNHLHSLRIIHRDIKPQNILIAYPQKNQQAGPRLVISDFGLCKTLPDNVSTLIGTTGNAGTVGWKAPELILQPKDAGTSQSSNGGHSRESSSSSDPVSQGVKRAVDIFSLGCVFFYVLTNGSHPFDDDEGWMQIRELNIKKNKPNFSRLNLGDESEEPIHLISWMLENKPEDRPTALQVMTHPFFWPPDKRLNFLCDCSDHWEREPRDPPSAHLEILQDCSYTVLDKKRDFLSKLDKKFIDSLGKQRKYTGDRMLDLLRALRNKKNHYEDMDEDVKRRVGPLPQGYLRYWTSKFPRLVMACYECVLQCGLENEPRFRQYFEMQSFV